MTGTLKYGIVITDIPGGIGRTENKKSHSLGTLNY